MSRERRDINIVLTCSSVYDESRRGCFDIPEIQKQTTLNFHKENVFRLVSWGFSCSLLVKAYKNIACHRYKIVELNYDIC